MPKSASTSVPSPKSQNTAPAQEPISAKLAQSIGADTANTKGIASACTDLALSMADKLFVLQQLIELAIERMPNNTDSDHSEAAIRAANRYVNDLHEIQSRFEDLPKSTEKQTAAPEPTAGGAGMLSQQEMASMLVAFGQMSASNQASIYGMIHDLAAANKLDGSAS